MNYRLARQLCVAVAMLGVPSLAMAQGQVSPADVGNRALSQTPILTSAQLGDLVAPIALYPDALLSQVLVASTYPLEVVQAQQWLRRNEGLRGEALMDAARQQPWDASVQGLVAFPDALATLNEDVQWTTALGNAFLAQESDVMAAVQRLRTQAQARGRLSSNPQQTVSAVAQEGRTVIEIVPADPQVIYVPQYDPYYVWGSPAWGAYPPLSYGYGYGYGAGLNVGFWFGGWSWGLGWGWGPNWYGGSVYVSDAFFRHCGYHYGHHGGHGGHNGGYDGGHNGGRNGGNNGGNQAGGHAGRETWQHDAGHRMGVPYTNSRIAGRYDAASQASRSTMTGLRSSSRAGGMATSTSSGTRALYQGSRGSGTDQTWRSGTRAEVSGSRGGGTDQGWRAGSRTEALGSRGGAADQSWRGGTRAEASGSRGGLAEQSWRGGTRTEASGSRGGGADRGWSSSGDQGRRSESAPQSRSLSSRYSAPSPRYSASSPRSSAPSSSYSAPSRSFSSSAPTRGFQSAPRSYSSSGGGRSYGSGSPQSSGGGGGSRGAGGGHGSGGGSRGGGHRR